MNKIVFITPTLKGGGAEKNMVNVINQLDNSVFDIYLIICGGENRYKKLLPEEITVIELHKNNVSSALPKVFRYIKSIKPQIVFTSASHLSIPIIFYKRIKRRDFINIVRVPSLPSNRLGNSMKDKIIDVFTTQTYKKANYVIAQSKEMYDEILSIYKVPASKTVIIGNIINERQIHELAVEPFSDYDSSKFNIVTVGTLYSVKGFDVLIESLAHVKREIPNVSLHIIGGEGIEKGYKQYLEDLVTEYDLNENIIFHGFQENPYKYIANAELLVLPSRKEGFPNVVLEALSLEIPVIVTNCIDFSQIITNGINGFIVNKEDANDLASKIIMGYRDLKKIGSKLNAFDYNVWFKELLNMS